MVKDFREYVLSLQNGTGVNFQHRYICDENDNVLVDYVGRFENIEETFKYIRNKLGIDPAKPFPHLNAGSHRRYQDYYDEETIEIVRKVLKKDIELFGYEFDKHPGPNLIINSRADFVPGTRL